VGRLNGLEAITVDANGTLVRLVDPLPKLERALREHCVERTREEIAAAFAAEGEHYRPRSLLGRDEETLQRLHAECAGVFLAELGADIDPVAFAPVYLAALVFEPVPGAVEALERARRAGIPLAVVSNWDARLPEILRRLGVDRLFETIVTSAEAAAAKPDPRIFELALARLRVAPEQVLHVGDDPWDEEGARRAGLRFAHAPIATALAGIG
jgi:2-haloalkanoic acid dehalogenase type II